MMSGQWERSILLSARSLLLSEEGTCSTRSFFTELLRQRAGSNLELDNLARVSLTAFDMGRSASSVGGPDAFPFPTGTRIIDAAIDSFCIEAHRVRDAEAEELAIHQCQESL